MQLSVPELIGLFRAQGCKALYAKRLAANDNSKNQIYFGPGFGALNLLPNKGVVVNNEAKTPNFKAGLDFFWLNDQGQIHQAPGAQLILYPDYPEVRFSGFLQRATEAPNALLRSREPNRVLFLGIRADERIIGYVQQYPDQLPEVDGDEVKHNGVFSEIPIGAEGNKTNRELLLTALRKIHLQGWIDSKQFRKDGTIGPCVAQNCGGYTLEAELGVSKNSNGIPDYLGYEVKQHDERNFDHVGSHAVTLLTPNPEEGYFREHGAAKFIRKYGYPDKSGIPDRLNFGGVHRVGEVNKLTGLKLSLLGFNPIKGTFALHGSLALLDQNNEVAAAWPFPKFLEHWRTKHANAVYVPSQKREVEPRAYRYGHSVRIGEHTDFITLLKAFHSGAVYYDPGLKLEHASTPEAAHKVRNQFRINSQKLGALYKKFDRVNVLL
ncbi:MAG: MvaI/BcnI family restriction endonuclease [Flavobacteriales bacterium]